MANEQPPVPTVPGTIEPAETAHAGGEPVAEEGARLAELGREAVDRERLLLVHRGVDAPARDGAHSRDEREEADRFYRLR